MIVTDLREPETLALKDFAIERGTRPRRLGAFLARILLIFQLDLPRPDLF